MRLIISFILAALMVSCATPPARSQADFLVVATCGTLPLAYAPGAVRPGTIDVNGKLCDTGSAATSDATAANQVLQITQATATNTLLGVQADAACATDNGTCTLAALTKRNNQRLTTLNTTLGTPMQATGGTVGLVAGTAIAGKFGIDQTTPGTTNLVAAGQNGTWTVQPGNTANTTAWLFGLNTTPSIANGNGVIIAPSSATSAALTPQTTAAAASNAVLKSSAGNLYDVTVTVGATSGWVMIFDATSLPSNGATGASMKWCYPVLSNGTVGGMNKVWHQPILFATGITVGFSSTACNSLTASATAFFYGGIQ